MFHACRQFCNHFEGGRRKTGERSHARFPKRLVQNSLKFMERCSLWLQWAFDQAPRDDYKAAAQGKPKIFKEKNVFIWKENVPHRAQDNINNLVHPATSAPGGIKGTPSTIYKKTTSNFWHCFSTYYYLSHLRWLEKRNRFSFFPGCLFCMFDCMVCTVSSTI